MTRLSRLLLIIAVAGLTVAAAAVYLNRSTVEQQLTPLVEIGGPFRLASSNGGFVDSKDLAGKPYGVFFGFTHCPEVCPTTMFEMSNALQKLGGGAKDFRLFFITVDPERDTAPMLKDYLANFDPRIEALVPTLEELPAVAKSFRVIYAKVPTSDGSYTMDHTASLFLFGRDGRFRRTISYGEPVESRLAKLEKLMAGE